MLLKIGSITRGIFRGLREAEMISNKTDPNILTQEIADSNFPLGATMTDQDRCAFQVWAPHVSELALRLHDRSEMVPMQRDASGYYSAVVGNVSPDTRYTFVLNGRVERPDPASRFQPDGPHGPSAVLAHDFQWTDHEWKGVPLRDFILYEVHVGTFTRAGTFDGMIPLLPELKELGITAIELMPVAQFPGSRNWGYDGVYPYAVQNSYGGPDGLKRLVNAAHAHGLAVVLDVVYNHLGPDGNYLRDFGPYFTAKYRTPWGDALNFDDQYSDEVRRFFLENALYWQTEFHLDGLRLDAVHAIHDESATPFLTELARATRFRAEQLQRTFSLIAESDLNDVRLILPEQLCGQGLDAQWSDDFHHSLHALLTGEREGYYLDFSHGVRQFAKVLEQGFGFTGEYSASRKRRHGNSPRSANPSQFVVCAQNHDQIGNRMLGERLSQLTSFEGLKVAAAAVLLSPYTPLLFMGEEWATVSPFQYFVSHTDPNLVEAIRRGRREEFSAFAWNEEPPDPQSEDTFLNCVLEPAELDDRQMQMRSLYQTLIALRKRLRARIEGTRSDFRVHLLESEQCVWLEYGAAEPLLTAIFCFSIEPVRIPWKSRPAVWKRDLDSATEEWSGPGSQTPDTINSKIASELTVQPRSAVIYSRLDTLDTDSGMRPA